MFYGFHVFQCFKETVPLACVCSDLRFAMFNFSEGSAQQSGLQLVSLPSATECAVGGTVNLGFSDTSSLLPLVPVDQCPTTLKESIHKDKEVKPKSAPKKKARNQEQAKSRRTFQRTRNATDVKKTKRTAPKIKKAKTNTASSSRGAKGKRVSKPRSEEQKEKPANDVFRETELKKSFQWPTVVMQKVFEEMDHEVKEIGPTHVQLFTEFSGAGTPEFSLAALTAAAPQWLTSCVVHQADIAATPQRALLNNRSETSHVFGDIEDVCSKQMLQKTQRQVAVEVTCCAVVHGFNPKCSFHRPLTNGFHLISLTLSS